MIKKIIKSLSAIFILSSLLSGCISLPPTPAFDLPEGSLVGYDIRLDETIAHTNHGFILKPEEIFEKQNWELNRYAKSEAERIIKLYGYTPIDVSADGPLISEVYIESLPKNRYPNEVERAELNRLRDLENTALIYNHQVSAVIRWVSKRSIVFSNCGKSGCSHDYANHPGLFSRFRLWVSPLTKAVLPSYSGVLIMEPRTRLVNWSGPYKNSFITPAVDIKEFKPKNYKKLTDRDWNQVREAIEGFITETIYNHVRAIKVGSDGQGAYVRDAK